MSENTGSAPQIEVKVVCPSCGSKRYHHNGRDGNWIYRVCQDCEYRGTTLRITQLELARMLDEKKRVA